MLNDTKTALSYYSIVMKQTRSSKAKSVPLIRSGIVTGWLIKDTVKQNAPLIWSCGNGDGDGDDLHGFKIYYYFFFTMLLALQLRRNYQTREMECDRVWRPPPLKTFTDTAWFHHEKGLIAMETRPLAGRSWCDLFVPCILITRSKYASRQGNEGLKNIRHWFCEKRDTLRKNRGGGDKMISD